jgi:hypothetical protein
MDSRIAELATLSVRASDRLGIVVILAFLGYVNGGKKKNK